MNPGVAAWLIKMGIAKDENGANYIAIGISIIALVCSFFLMFSHNAKRKLGPPPEDRNSPPIQSPRTKGFTLIELLMAISIISLLSTTMLSNFKSARINSRDAQRIASIKQLQGALDLYWVDNGSYPVSGSMFISTDLPHIYWGTFGVCNDPRYSTLPNVNSFLSAYLSGNPRDPISNDFHCYFYQTLADGGSYMIMGLMENDALNGKSPWCPGDGYPGGWPGWYCVHS
jgi:prepilin-type N-terminal cleavage/methylation domain-containing protein